MNLPAAFMNSATCLGTIESQHNLDPLTASDIHRALVDPVWPDGDKRTVFDIIEPGNSVCFVVSDHTRKTATDAVLPVVMSGLTEKGCSPREMFILIASGIHRSPTPAEIARILGYDIAALFEGRIFQHDPDSAGDLVEVGTTKRGCLVKVNRRAIEAKRLVLLGAATFHYHAGFGGGRKSLVPGLAARSTIAFNHSLTLDPERDGIHPDARVGVLDGNPVAEEMLESAYMCKPDIIINTVIAPDGGLVGVFSGELDAAHRAACGQVERICSVEIGEKADIVVASAGSALNWIQSHKALCNAYRAVKETGRVILQAPCPEGLGDERFRHWITKRDISAIYSELRVSPEVLGQTALSSRIKGARTVLVTDMPEKDAADLGIETAADLDSAVARVVKDGPARPTYYLMPQARYTLPCLQPAARSD
jgi:nickel-dependent lactate racemase